MTTFWVCEVTTKGPRRLGDFRNNGWGRLEDAEDMLQRFAKSFPDRQYQIYTGNEFAVTARDLRVTRS